MKIKDLTAVSIYVKALQDGKLRVTNGRQTHSCFFMLLSDVNADLAYRLHESNQEKPYTVSCLQALNAQDDQQKNAQFIPVLSGHRYKFRISVMTAELSLA